MIANIGFIGLGIMGKPMAGHLVNAGNNVFVYDLSQDSVQQLEAQGAHPSIMVPDTPDVEAVLFGPDGVAEGLQPGTTVVDMNSISPIATKDFAQRLNELGAKMLYTPMSGGHVGAENAPQ